MTHLLQNTPYRSVSQPAEGHQRREQNPLLLAGPLGVAVVVVLGNLTL